MAFNWSEGRTTVREFVRAVVADITMASANRFLLHYPTNISGIQDMAILRTTTTHNHTFYIKIERPENVLNYVLITVGTKYDPATQNLDPEIASVPARFAWYRISPVVPIFDWTSVQYWMSYSEDFLNIVVQGDPSLDVHPYKNYLISYAYIGALESFEGADADDMYNFGLTVSSDDFWPDVDIAEAEKYGKRTATGVTDIPWEPLS